MKLQHFIIIPLLLLPTGCSLSTVKSDQSKSPETEACIQACGDALKANHDLSAGPCLLDPNPTNPDWVCDVAHSPRQTVDNQPANQCSAFATGQANHFIEVTPDCELIKTY